MARRSVALGADLISARSSLFETAKPNLSPPRRPASLVRGGLHEMSSGEAGEGEWGQGLPDTASLIFRSHFCLKGHESE